MKISAAFAILGLLSCPSVIAFPGNSIAFNAVSRNSPTMTWISTSSDNVSQTTYTFTSVSFGTTDISRKMLLTVGGVASVARTISSVTVGGVSATRVVGCTGTSSDSGIYYVDMPTGTSGNVVITFSGAMLASSFSIFRATSLDSVTPYSTATSTADPLDLSVSSPSGKSILVAYSGGYTSTTPQSTTWTGATENADVTLTLPGPTYSIVSAANTSFDGSQTTRTISADITGTNSLRCGASAVFK